MKASIGLITPLLRGNKAGSVYKSAQAFCKVVDSSYLIEIPIDSSYGINAEQARRAIPFQKDYDVYILNPPMDLQAVMMYDRICFDYFNDSFKGVWIHDSGCSIIPSLQKYQDKFNLFNVHKDVQNAIEADFVIFCSKVVRDDTLELMKEVYSEKIIEQLKQKSFVCPSLDYFTYKKRDTFDPSEVGFLWNSRKVEGKGWDVFEQTVIAFQNAYPEVNTRVYICGFEKMDRTGMKNVEFKGLIQDPVEYEDFISKANCTLFTSRNEAFSLSYTEGLLKNNLMYGIKSRAYPRFYGDQYSFSSIEKAIVQIRKDIDNPHENQAYHKNRLNTHIFKTPEDANTAIHSFLDKFMEYERGSNTEVLAKIIAFIQENKYCTKSEIYTMLDWNQNSTSFWKTYYYKLRKEGMNVFDIGRKQYYSFRDEYEEQPVKTLF